MKKHFKLQSFVLIIGIILISCLPAIGQIDCNYRENEKKAYNAITVEECKSSLYFCNEVLKVVPNHPVINYLSARLNALLGNDDLALEYLQKATKLGYTTKLRFNKIHHLNDTAFCKIHTTNKFDEIIKTLQKAEKPIHKSQVAFTLSDKKLVTEGITYDPVEKMFYLGSMNKHKIVKVDYSGNIINFTSEGQDGLCEVLGIHVDAARRTLWACSYSENKNEIFKYDLSSGVLINKYSFPQNEIKNTFNDLVIHPDGDVFISNPSDGEVFVIPHSSDKLELFLKSDLIVAPNGITLSEDGRVIYLADYKIGIYKIDIKTKSFSLLSHEPDFYPYGIDGLYFEDNKLYALQIGLNQISKFSLNEDATHIESCEIFERDTPEFISPTTGVIIDDYFYYIIHDGGSSDNPKGVVVMKVPLKQ
ncbi:MAG: SMP-30/gluconolactonase/LRE family protein [Bacteroidetes bacterium]|nr:SMP-30/gluconolactonase/LRE family protein [Bacteroidota bacterium]